MSNIYRIKLDYQDPNNDRFVVLTNGVVGKNNNFSSFRDRKNFRSDGITVGKYVYINGVWNYTPDPITSPNFRISSVIGSKYTEHISKPNVEVHCISKLLNNIEPELPILPAELIKNSRNTNNPVNKLPEQSIKALCTSPFNPYSGKAIKPNKKGKIYPFDNTYLLEKLEKIHERNIRDEITEDVGPKEIKLKEGRDLSDDIHDDADPDENPFENDEEEESEHEIESESNEKHVSNDAYDSLISDISEDDSDFEDEIDIRDDSGFEAFKYEQENDETITEDGVTYFAVKKGTSAYEDPSYTDDIKDDDFVPKVDVNGETCIHNQEIIDTWEKAKVYIGEMYGNEQYPCKHCGIRIACQHLKDIAMRNDITTWTYPDRESLKCIRCREAIQFTDINIRDSSIINQYSVQIKYIEESVSKIIATYLENGNVYGKNIKSLHTALIFSTLDTFYQKYRTEQSRDAKNMTILYGVMYFVIFIVIFMDEDAYGHLSFKFSSNNKELNLKNIKIDKLKSIMPMELATIANKESIQINMPYITSFITSEFGKVVETLMKEKLNKKPTGRERSTTTAQGKAVLEQHFDLNSVMKKNFGLSDTGIAKTFPNGELDYRLPKEIKIDPKRQAYTIPDVYTLPKHQVRTTASAVLYQGCGGDLDKLHVLYDEETKKPLDKCAECGEKPEDLLEKDDEAIIKHIEDESFRKTLEEQTMFVCPEDGLKHNKVGDKPCTKCGHPNTNTEEYIGKYGHMVYNVIDIDDFEIIQDLDPDTLVSYEVSDTSFPDPTIIGRLPSEFSISDKIYLLKHIIYTNSHKLGLENMLDLDRVTNLADMGKYLYQNKNVNKELSALISSYLKTNNKDDEDIVPPTESLTSDDLNEPPIDEESEIVDYDSDVEDLEHFSDADEEDL